MEFFLAVLALFAITWLVLVLKGLPPQSDEMTRIRVYAEDRQQHPG